ncbi:isoamyl acetate-hydrolyzing esterase [Perkinsus olseni]|uniref:Isoamyl acetate-hydrolyzing esterase n=1 Tax=Perkinsus olseni TaxID=32597 RepID=A0A7J6LV52_PEROL|nr:isoamyl acetate-hydrolyzing esterase [Perkinsus olseni]
MLCVLFVRSTGIARTRLSGVRRRHFCAAPATDHAGRLDSVTVGRPAIVTRTDQGPLAAFNSVSNFYGFGTFNGDAAGAEDPAASWSDGSLELEAAPVLAHRAAARGCKIADDQLAALVLEGPSTDRTTHMYLGHCMGAAIESECEGVTAKIMGLLGSSAPPRHPTLASLVLVRLLTSPSPLDHRALLEASAACAGDREDELTAVDAYRIRLATLLSPLATELLDDGNDASSMSLSFVNFIGHIVRGTAQSSREAAMREVLDEGWRDIYDISELIGKPQLHPADASDKAHWGFYTGTAPNREFGDVGSLFFPVVDPAEKIVYEPIDGFYYVNDKARPRWIHKLRHTVAQRNGYTVKMSPAAEWTVRAGLTMQSHNYDTCRGRILLLGDSVTQQSFSGVDGWAGLLADRYQRRADIINRGYSGYNTPMTLEVARHIFKKGSPHMAGGPLLLVVIFLGANDSQLPGMVNSSGSESKHVPVEKFRGALEEIVDLAKPFTSRLILITPPPINGDAIVADGKARFGASAPDQPNRKLQFTEEYSKAVEQVGERSQIPVLNTFDGMQREAGWRSFLRDGLHFSPSGSRWFYEALIKTINEEYPEIAVEAGPDGVSYGNSSSRSALTAEMPWHEQFYCVNGS